MTTASSSNNNSNNNSSSNNNINNNNNNNINNTNSADSNSNDASRTKRPRDDARTFASWGSSLKKTVVGVVKTDSLTDWLSVVGVVKTGIEVKSESSC